jgi:hypothetical protein
MTKLYNSLLGLVLIFTINVYGQNKAQTIEELLKLGVLNMGNDSIESLPIFYQKANVPFIKVVIDGKEYFFLFDTGASGCLISEEIGINSKIENSIPIFDDSGNETKANAVLKNIKIGSGSFNNILCLTGNTKRLSELGCVKIDGIIGANLLMLCNWEINPVEETISFSKTAFKRKLNSFEFDIEFTNNQLPLINFNYDDITFYTLIDFGYSDYFELNNEILKKSNKYRKLNKNIGIGQHSLTINSINEEKIYNLVIDTLKNGNAYLSNIPTMINNSKPKLGSSLLKRYIISYNTFDKKFIFTPISYDTSAHISYSVKLGLNEASELIIIFVWQDKFTKKAGLKIGQKIVKIDNQEYNQLSYSQLCELKNKLDSQNKFTISVQKGNKIKVYDINKTVKLSKE